MRDIRYSPYDKKPRCGFSLVELSIVLVILGLLTGGILAGQSLIRAAELRSITTEYQNYQVAIQTFRGKYLALPGDMKNATRFWGAADTSGTAGECGDPNNDTGTGTETCNGNGNQQIGESSGWRFERFRVWQHMNNAGLIAGNYEGTHGPSGVNHAIPGTNVPAAKISNAGWNLLADSVGSPNKLQIGAPTTGSAWEAIITPEEAWNIDQKHDDGLPESGSIVSDNVGCKDTSVPSEYALTIRSIECGLVFLELY